MKKDARPGIVCTVMLVHNDESEYHMLLVDPVDGKSLISLTSNDENAALVADVLGIQIHKTKTQKSWHDAEEVSAEKVKVAEGQKLVGNTMSPEAASDFN